jgi:hypothetical protein
MSLQFLTVLNPPNELEDIKPLAAGSYGFWVVLLLAFLLLLAIAAYFLWPNPKPKPVLPPLPRDLANQELEAMKKKIDTAPGYDFSIEVSSILRRFIEQQFGFHASRQTTFEFLSEMTQTSRIKPPFQERIRSFLMTCDPIKFGRADLGTQTCSKLYDQARSFVQEAE